MELDDPEPRPKDGRFTGTPIRLQRRTDREHRPQTDHRIDPARQGTLTRTAERLLPGRDHMRRTESTEMPDRILIRIRPCSFDEQGRAHYDEPSLLFLYEKQSMHSLSAIPHIHPNSIFRQAIAPTTQEIRHHSSDVLVSI